MTTFSMGLIDKKLAHKSHLENVFVRDLRRSVPSTLPRNLVEEAILPALDATRLKLFREYFQPWTTPTGEPVYTLFNVPHELPARLFSDHEDPDAFTAAEKKTLLRSYVADATRDVYQLRGPVTEMEDVVLAAVLSPKGLALTENERMTLANLLESIPNIPREDIFHGSLHVDPTHAFFFEHPNEHVPGMMLLEAARQFAIACWHVFGLIPLQGSQFIMNELKASFRDYINLNYPAGFKAEVKDLVRRKTGEWSTANLHVSVIQQNSVCAEMEFPSQVVSKRSFQRLRSERQKTDPHHRFFPISSIHHRLSLWDPASQRYLDAKLWDISLDGLRAEFMEEKEERALPSTGEVLLYFEGVGFIRAQCTLVWYQSGRGTRGAGFRFQELTVSDREHLQTVIRQYCHVRREREQL